MNNAELFARACRVLPGGVDSPVRAFRAVSGTPFFTERGEGAFLVDAEGNRYLDYVMSWGPLLLGHAPAAVVQAVREAAEHGLTFGTPTGRETLLAEEIALAAPHMQMMRLVNSGTEATMSAVRVARGFTGREKVIKFAGNYHGHSDGLLVRAGSGCLTGGVPDSLGEHARRTVQRPCGRRGTLLRQPRTDRLRHRRTRRRQYGRRSARRRIFAGASPPLRRTRRPAHFR